MGKKHQNCGYRHNYVLWPPASGLPIWLALVRGPLQTVKAETGSSVGTDNRRRLGKGKTEYDRHDIIAPLRKQKREKSFESYIHAEKYEEAT